MSNKVIKKRAVEHKGGGCLICGYNKCQGALDFHHINAHEKEFNISDYTKWDVKLLAELDKCALLCKNCHQECHQGLISHDIFEILEV